MSNEASTVATPATEDGAGVQGKAEGVAPALLGQFRKYDHLERLGHPEVSDIDIGLCHVFPKLDGTNASVWVSRDGRIQAGSRNRVLSTENDNAGFCAWVHSEDPKAMALRAFLHQMPHLVVYGEWLVPHSIKTYRPDAWRRFWIFDVYSHDRGRYLAWDEYRTLLDGHDVIEPVCTMDNPSKDQILRVLKENTYLVRDGEGIGEGVVLKNYAWANKFGRQPWAKMVSTEFREKNAREFGAKHVKGEFQVEQAAVEDLCTAGFVRKTWAKVLCLCANDDGVVLDTEEKSDEFAALNRHRVIPRFLGTVWHDFVLEECWTMVKKHRNPVVDFGKLQKLVQIKAKSVMAEVF